MSTVDEATPLPPDAGEVLWRGLEPDGDLIVVTAGKRVWLWTDRGNGRDDWFEFHDAEMHAHVFRAWALSERTRAETAEKIADAMRRHRDAICALHTYVDTPVEWRGPMYAEARSAMNKALEDLRTLGAEP